MGNAANALKSARRNAVLSAGVADRLGLLDAPIVGWAVEADGTPAPIFGVPAFAVPLATAWGYRTQVSK